MSNPDDIRGPRNVNPSGYGETRPVDPLPETRASGGYPAGYAAPGSPVVDPVAGRAGRRSPRRIIDARRLWSGGVMAGVVGAGVAIVGLLIARGILNVPVLIERKGHLVNANTWWYAVVAFLVGIVATGLLHLLLAGVPRPYQFFGWIFGLAVAIAALVPFTTGAALSSKVAVSLINLAIGITIGSIVSSIGHSSARVLDEPYA